MKLINAFDFQILYQKIRNQPMSLKLAYKLNKLHQRANTEVVFYNEELLKLLESYARRDSNGNFIPNHDGTGYLIKDGLVIECQEKVQELQGLEIEDLNITFTLDELDNITITPAELSCIESLIVE